MPSRTSLVFVCINSVFDPLGVVFHRVATLLLELMFMSLATHPLRSHHEQQLHSGLAWGSRNLGLIETYGISTALSRQLSHTLP